MQPIHTTSFFPAVIHSFYSRHFYQEVGRIWQGLGLRYLLKLLIIGWIPFIILLMIKISAINTAVPQNAESSETVSLNSMVNAIITQLPLIIIENGAVHLQDPQPYNIVDPTTNRLLMVIDASGKINSLQGTDALILITKRDLYARSPSLGEMHYTIEELAGQEKVILDRAVAIKWVESTKTMIRWLLPLVFFPLTVMISFIYTMMGAFFYAILGFGISRLLKLSLEFIAIIRLSVVASTPAVFFQMLSLLSPPVLLGPYLNFIFFALSIGYLFFAISSNQLKEQE